MKFFLFFLLFLPSVIFSQNSYFVALESSGGNDSTNLGTINSPFATINKALSIMNSGDTCFVRGGTYYQDVVISNKNNIVLTSYNDEFVCFDGTRKINTNWTNYNGNIFQTTLDNHIWQLFVDNNEMVMARWPNANFTDKSIYNLDSWASGIVDSVAGFPDGSYNGFELVDPSNYNLAATGLNITGAIGIMNVGSFKTYNREITSHNANENFFSYNPVPNNAYRDKHHNFYLEGKLDFLDQANEWYYDTTTMILYLYPDNGQNPNGRNIKGKTQEYAISIDNSNNITINNFFFFSTTFLAKSSSGLIIENCHFSFPNCSKRMLKDFLSSPNVTSLGQSGNINNVNNSIIRKCLFEYTDGDALRIYGDNNLVENCYMQYIDYTVSELPFLMVGVYINGDMNRFVHNTIHHSSASAFIAPGTSPEFAYNEVYATGSLQSDGSVYQGTAATVQNSNIHHNYIHDTPKYALRFDAPGGSPGQAGQYGKMHHNIAVRTNGIMVKGNHHYICYNTTFSSNKNGLIILDEDNSNDSSFIYNNFSEKMSAHRANQLPIPGFNSNNWNGYDNPNIHFSSLIDTLNYLPLLNSSLIDSGLIVSNIAHQFSGNSPDIGALEFGITPWHVGVDWQPTHFPWNLGCIDSLAINYNINALIDDGSCIYCTYGCTDSTAFNYDPLSNCDDSSCVFQFIPCSELFFSEYVCSDLNNTQNRAIEIYNPTNNIINLDEYQLERYRNGDTNNILGGITLLSGSLMPGDVWVITNGDTVDIGYGIISPILYNLRDQAPPDGSYPTPLHMNGDDVIILSKILTGEIIDVIGRIGEDPGTGWTSDSSANFTISNGADPWTRNHTLIRKPHISQPDNYGYDLFNPSLQWDSLPSNTWFNLGFHQCNCPIYGCIDSLASNYNPLANTDNGSCNYIDCNGVVNGTSIIDSCGSCVVAGVCDISDLANITCVGVGDTIGQTYQFMYLPIFGDSFFASNDTLSIYFPPSFNGDWNLTCSGCTDSLAFNYDSLAIINDSSCNYCSNNITPNSQDEFDINGIRTSVGPGAFFWDGNNSKFEVPKGSGKHTIFAHDYWFGALDSSGNVRTAAMTYGPSQTGIDYWSGPFTSECDTTNFWDRVWKIDRNMIDVHTQSFNSPQYVLTMSDVIRNWPAHGDTLLGQSYNLAPFIDLNSNGQYEPLLGDYPDFKGDQAIYIIRNDNGFHSETGSPPLGIEQHIMFYGYKCDDNLAVNHTLFVNMKIFNRGGNNLSDFYCGTWVDVDLGYMLDDYVGCHVGKNLGYVYNGDSFDEGVNGYGSNPPAQGLVYLNSNMSNFVTYNNDFSVTGNPENAQHYYNYLSGYWKDNTPITFGGNGYGGGTQTSYMYPDTTDSVFTAQSWTEQSAGNFPADRRMLMSIGPFNFNNNDFYSLDYAFVFARDTNNSSNSNSVALLFDYVDHIQDFYDNSIVNNNSSYLVCDCLDSVPLSFVNVMSCYSGCTDSLALNYDSLSVIDNGSCCYSSGCTDPLAINYDSLACYDDSSCIATISGCTDPLASNYSSNAIVDDGSCEYITCYPDSQFTLEGIYPDSLTGLSNAYVNQPYNEVLTAVIGLDTLYEIFPLGAIQITIDSVLINNITGLPSSFTYSCNPVNCSYDAGTSGCMNIYSISNPTIADTGLYQLNIEYTIYASNIPLLGSTTLNTFNNDYSINIIGNIGCMDSLACNYDSLANINDSLSCIYISNPVVDLTMGQWIMEGDFGCDSVIDGVWYIDYQSNGTYIYSNDPFLSNSWPGLWSLCGNNYIDTDSMLSYWYTGTYSNGIFSGQMQNNSGCWIMYPNLGCTDSTAVNYNPTITINDGSCLYSGCTDSTALNFNFNANIDDGSCIYCTNDTSYTNITACDSYTWDGVTYNASGVYTNTYTNTNGCDSIHTLSLTLINSSSGSTTVISCDSYTWDGVTYNTSGIYTNTYTNTNGCDSVHTLDLTLINSSSGFTTVISCDSYTWDGVTYNASGVYTNTYTNTNGCDSIHTLSLTIINSSSGSTNVTSCDSYTWDGLNYAQSGMYTNTYTNVNGCDSVHTLNLTINNSYTDTFSITSCNNYLWNSAIYDSSGTYTNIFTGINGCDSIQVLDLIINTADTFVTNVTACDNYSWDGVIYSASGIYTTIYNTFSGCDSVCILYLTINNSFSETTQISICDSYVWHGITYDTSGLFTNVYTNAQGCDSIHILDLNIYNSDTISSIVMACDSFVWDSITYNSSGTYTNFYSNIYGCDSVHSLYLTISNSTNEISNITSCDSYVWDGVTYNVSGVYSNIYTNTNGCDSIYTINLTIDNSYNITNNQTLCFGDSLVIGNNFYSTSGVYIDSFPAVNGCDSIIISNLDITSQQYVNILQNGLSLVVSNFGGTPPYSFTWNTNEITSQITPLNNGIYWLIVEDYYGCQSDTVFVEVDWIPAFINNLEIDNFKIYPNPSRDVFNISFTSNMSQDLEITIKNLIGEEINKNTLEDYKGDFNYYLDLSSFSKGIYLLNLKTSKGNIIHRLILN